jgi:inorganic pyrophosphatase
MQSYLDLPIGDQAPRIVHAVIEIPLGESNKYEYDKKLDIFRLDRNLYSAVHYPGDYGFIPQTISEDKDPLDVLVLVDVKTFTGCLVEVRPIGMLEMVDQGMKDEKILGGDGEQSAVQRDQRLFRDLSAHAAGDQPFFRDL